MARTFALVGMLVVVLGVAGCELAAAQLLAQFEFSLEPEQIVVAAGSSEDVRVTIAPATGITLSAVTVTLLSPPAGVTAEQAIVVTVTDWTIAVANTVAPGTYELEVEAVSQGMNLLPVIRTRTLTLVVP